ncbi:MAG: prolyl oligopeptidase family serine peptidase [Gemmatimonadota bacterium]
MPNIHNTVRSIAGLFCVAALASVATPVRGSAQNAATAAASSAIWKQLVTFKSGDLTLSGYLFRPAGAGPFKALIWNHGSEKNPGGGPQFDSVAAIFVPAGYVVFAPVRRGHGTSQGAYVVDDTDRERAARGAGAANRLVVHLLESEQLDDQLAGLRYLKSLAYVDTTRLVVAGCSYGGIQTLLGAERGVGYTAAVSISPAALSWNGNALLQDRLVKAVRGINIPVFLLQPPEDASLEPSRVLGAEFHRLGKAYQGKIYPADIPDAFRPHCFGGAKGMHIWKQDVLAFLAARVR